MDFLLTSRWLLLRLFRLQLYSERSYLASCKKWKMGSNLDLCFKNLVFFSQPPIRVEPLSNFADPPADI